MSNTTETFDFQDLGLSEATLAAIKAKGFETPSPIQRLAIPALLEGTKDIIAQAQTGTGKTAAFGLPILEQLEPNGKVQALILAPTRELALQVSDELISFKGGRHVSVATIYGGASIIEQLRRLKKGVDIVVGTPGRVIDHINRGSLDLSGIRWFILDEADEMLNMGFVDDIESIFKETPENRRVMLFSATMPERIAKLAKKYMRDVEHLKVESAQMTTSLTDQIYFEVSQGERFDALTRIIDVEPEFYGLVFCRTKVSVDEVVNNLIKRGYEADGLHGDLTQLAREKILSRFRNKNINILVATDVAARGIDISSLTHVINYSLPQDFESYVHRIGRTGRAGKEGTAITFISPGEYRLLAQMQRVIKTQLRKEKLPNAEDVVAVKRTRIKDELASIIELSTYNDYLGLAQEIIDEHGADVALAALIRLAYKNELDVKNYAEIRSFKVDKKGTARLFIALGKYDDMTPKDLVDFLKKHTKLTDSKIDDIKVCDAFSFATVPFEDAEEALRSLNKLRSNGDKPLAEISKAAPGEGHRRSSGGGRDRDRGSRSGERGGEGRRRSGGGEGSSGRRRPSSSSDSNSGRKRRRN
ncbi:MAG: DEAD/DEAH box helicase [Prevotellaceae bacterium]|jgi:ATP-dependent RNA helicase DeaD|nr:DEAD/DEAH box helicase [Prevotellaceae bacterium]